MENMSINDIIDIQTSKFKKILLGGGAEKNVKLLCTFILTSGKNKGSSCVSVIKNDTIEENPRQLCSRHKKKAKSVETIDFDEPKILKRINLNGKILMTDGNFLYEETSDNEGVYVGKMEN
jgi:hypothetical protein